MAQPSISADAQLAGDRLVVPVSGCLLHAPAPVTTHLLQALEPLAETSLSAVVQSKLWGICLGLKNHLG